MQVDVAAAAEEEAEEEEAEAEEEEVAVLVVAAAAISLRGAEPAGWSTVARTAAGDVDAWLASDDGAGDAGRARSVSGVGLSSGAASVEAASASASSGTTAASVAVAASDAVSTWCARIAAAWAIASRRGKRLAHCAAARGSPCRTAAACAMGSTSALLPLAVGGRLRLTPMAAATDQAASCPIAARRHDSTTAAASSAGPYSASDSVDEEPRRSSSDVADEPFEEQRPTVRCSGAACESCRGLSCVTIIGTVNLPWLCVGLGARWRQIFFVSVANTSTPTAETLTMDISTLDCHMASASYMVG